MTATADDAVRGASFQLQDVWKAVCRSFPRPSMRSHSYCLMLWAAAALSIRLAILNGMSSPWIRSMSVALVTLIWVLIWLIIRTNSLVVNTHPSVSWALVAIASPVVLGSMTIARGADIFIDELRCGMVHKNDKQCSNVLLAMIFSPVIAIAMGICVAVYLLEVPPAVYGDRARAWDLLGRARKIVCFGIPATLCLLVYVFQMQQHTRGALTLVAFVAVACSCFCASLSLLSFVHMSWISPTGILSVLCIHAIVFGTEIAYSKYLWPWMFDSDAASSADAYVCMVAAVSLGCIPGLVILLLVAMGVRTKLAAMLHGPHQ